MGQCQSKKETAVVADPPLPTSTQTPSSKQQSTTITVSPAVVVAKDTGQRHENEEDDHTKRSITEHTATEHTTSNIATSNKSDNNENETDTNDDNNQSEPVILPPGAGRPASEFAHLPIGTADTPVDIGTRVAVHWGGEDLFFKGTIEKERMRKKKKKEWFVHYDDGDTEWLDLTKERFYSLPAKVHHIPGSAAANSNIAAATATKSSASGREKDERDNIDVAEDGSDRSSRGDDIGDGDGEDDTADTPIPNFATPEDIETELNQLFQQHIKANPPRRYEMGTRVYKHFRRDQWDQGEIVEYDEEDELYRVRYDTDGYEEQFEFPEVALMVVQHELYFQRDEPRFPVGTKVYKEFPPNGWYVGEISKHTKDHYVVKYEDGDEDELPFGDEYSLAGMVQAYVRCSPEANGEGGHYNETARTEEWTDFMDRYLTKEYIPKRLEEYAAANRRYWKICQGNELEPALKSGAIALLDAQWLINFAYGNLPNRATTRNDDTPVLPRRQDLPPEAFLSLEKLKESSGPDGESYGNPELQVICLSYMWLHPDNPDPLGATLKIVANWLHEKFFVRPFLHPVPRYGIFWDYGSLFQSPRTPKQDKLFAQGLDNLAKFYSHPNTYCFQVTELPKGYPDGYNLPDGANSALYYDRGWPFVESSLIGLSKPPNRTFDISNDWINGRHWNSRNRPALMTPERLWERLQDVSFTNAKSDRPLVMKLYQNEFAQRLKFVEQMDFRRVNWNYEQITYLSEVISGGYVPNLKSLNLEDNDIGPQGYKALADALMGPGLEYALESIALYAHKGYEVMAEAMLDISKVFLWDCTMGVPGCKALVDAAKKRSEKGFYGFLRVLLIDWENGTISAEEGAEHIFDLLWLVPPLEELSLSGCGIGVQGCEALVRAVKTMISKRSAEKRGGKRLRVQRGTTVKLRRLTLDNNKSIGDKGLHVLSELIELVPSLELLSLRDCKLTDAGLQHFAKAALEYNGKLEMELEAGAIKYLSSDSVAQEEQDKTDALVEAAVAKHPKFKCGRTYHGMRELDEEE